MCGVTYFEMFRKGDVRIWQGEMFGTTEKMEEDLNEAVENALSITTQALLTEIFAEVRSKKSAKVASLSLSQRIRDRVSAADEVLPFPGRVWHFESAAESGVKPEASC